jgi:hypothetical protein
LWKAQAHIFGTCKILLSPFISADNIAVFFY